MRKSDPILMAAKDAFIENGFGNTSMDDVARRAGTTKRTVYNNFGSKERLLEAVIDHSILLFETAVPPLGPEADPEQIRDFCEMLLQLMTWRAAIGLQRLIIAEGPTFPAEGLLSNTFCILATKSLGQISEGTMSASLTMYGVLCVRCKFSLQKLQGPKLLCIFTVTP